MSTLLDFIFRRTESIPCLFYPVAKKLGIPLQRLLSDPQVQADLLVEIARQRLLVAYAGYRNWRLSTGCDLSPQASMNSVDCMLQCHDQFFEVAQNAPSS